jgi:hypothetical protein
MYRSLEVMIHQRLRALTDVVPCRVSNGLLAAFKFVNDLNRIALGDNDVAGEYLHHEATSLFSERKQELRSLIKSTHKIKATLSSSPDPLLVTLRIEFLSEQKGSPIPTIEASFVPLTGTLISLDFKTAQQP